MERFPAPGCRSAALRVAPVQGVERGADRPTHSPNPFFLLTASGYDSGNMGGAKTSMSCTCCTARSGIRKFP